MSISEKTDKSRLTKEERAGKGTGDEHVKVEGELAKEALKSMKKKAGQSEKEEEKE